MKSLLLWVILLILTGHAYAQSSATAAKQGIKLVFERSYLHTDRDVYAGGDTLWFKAYLVNAQTNKLINSSNNLYVDLISPDARIISTLLIRLDYGVGNGDLELKDTLAPGTYHLRAYTNWMRNFGDHFIFSKAITILNNGSLAAADPLLKKTSAIKGDKIQKNVSVPALPIKSFNLQFYPEGGALVEGIGSLIAIKAMDNTGKGLAVEGNIVSSTGDTVTSFSCDTLGMGLFTLLPLKGQVYRAVVHHKTSFTLPAPLKSGLTLQLKQTDSLLRIIISSTEITGLNIKPTYNIVIKHNGVTLADQQIPFVAQQTVVKISTASFPEGISAITLYDANHKPQCERLVYIHHPGNNSIRIKADKATYQPKEKVTIQISAPGNTQLSMAVVDAGMVPQQAGNLITYLMLSSELKGTIEQAHRYFDTTNVNRFKQLDLLLMTQGWRDYIWRRLADTAIRISYAAENSISLTGKVRDEVKNKMMPGLNLSLHASAAKGVKMFAGSTDSIGMFRFSNLIIYGKQNIKLSSINNKGEKRGMITIDTLSPLPFKLVSSPLIVLNNNSDSIITTAIVKRATQIKNATVNGVTRLKEVKVQGRQAMILRSGGVMMPWGNDQVFNITPADHKYKTLEWFLMQNTKGATMPVTDPNRTHGPDGEVNRPLTGIAYPGVDTFKVYKPSISAGPDYFYRPKTKALPPILFVNGRELFMDNYDQAEAYRNIYFPMPLHKIRSITLKRVTGTLHGYGIEAQAEMIAVDRYLLYLTLTSDAMIDNPGSLNADIEGYYSSRQFYQPPPGAKPSMADFRATIHWQPYIKTDSNGKATVSFYNGAVSTPVNIIVQGITPEGVPVSTMVNYTIK